MVPMWPVPCPLSLLPCGLRTQGFASCSEGYARHWGSSWCFGIRMRWGSVGSLPGGREPGCVLEKKSSAESAMRSLCLPEGLFLGEDRCAHLSVPTLPWTLRTSLKELREFSLCLKTLTTQSCLPLTRLGKLQDQYLLRADRSHCLGAGHQSLWFGIWFSAWACDLVCEIEGLDPN